MIHDRTQARLGPNKKTILALAISILLLATFCIALYRSEFIYQAAFNEATYFWTHIDTRGGVFDAKNWIELSRPLFYDKRGFAFLLSKFHGDNVGDSAIAAVSLLSYVTIFWEKDDAFISQSVIDEVVVYSKNIPSEVEPPVSYSIRYFGEKVEHQLCRNRNIK